VIYAFLALSYLLGATPTSYWVGRVFHGKDLREHGSGNLGATNALRVLGWRSALPVVLMDTLKGYIPVSLFAELAGVGFPWTLALGTAAILGHMFSLWVGFKGGKGMATSAGVFLGLAPWAVLIGFALWLLLTLATGYVSLASIAAAAVLPPLIAVTPHQGGDALVWFATPLAVFVVWKHRANIGRLMRGEENRFRRGSSQETPQDGPGVSADAEVPS
jgi:glycerol-3-phosphate acyltransferase PlsY